MNFILLSSCFKIPHPSKAKFGGEDACFTSNKNSALGVADGVGGWVTYRGSNSAKYSQDLMNYSKQFSYLQSPLQILEKAFDNIDRSIPGSTTATVAKLNGNNLSIINVGDSGCELFRDFHNIYLTKSTVHGFNFPYQLGYLSETVPSNGTIDHITVYGDDILVCASDGLWDNLFMSDIEQILWNYYDAGMDPKEFCNVASQKLSEIAVEYAKKSGYKSPFYQEAHKNGIPMPEGGKLDDTTVVVAIVQKEDNL